MSARNDTDVRMSMFGHEPAARSQEHVFEPARSSARVPDLRHRVAAPIAAPTTGQPSADTPWGWSWAIELPNGHSGE